MTTNKFREIRGFSVAHGNNLKVTIFSELRLGIKNNIKARNEK